MHDATAIYAGRHLYVPAYWPSVTPAEIEEYANGCGRASWPYQLRQLLDSWTGFRGPADIHDIEWEIAAQWVAMRYVGYLERYLEDLRASNIRFYANCRRVVMEDTAPLWRHPICRVRGELHARAFWRAVQIGASHNVREMREAYPL